MPEEVRRGNELPAISATETARRYVEGCLSRGKGLSRHLLESWGFDRRDIRTTVPGDLGTNVENFVPGGQLAEALLLGLPKPEKVLTDFILEELGSGRASAFVVEDELRKRTDRAAAEIPGRVFARDDVYCFLGNASDEATIDNALLKTFAPYLNVMVLVGPSFAGRVPAEGDDIDDELLRDVAVATTVLIVGAYDHEAHLVWRR